MLKLMAVAAGTAVLSIGLTTGAATASSSVDASARSKASARTLKSARSKIKVLRRSKVSRDTIRVGGSRKARARMAALNSRLVYDKGAASRIYVAVDGSRLCLYEVSEVSGYAAGGCQEATEVLSGRTTLLYMAIGRTDARFAALALDGASSAAELNADGAVRRDLTIADNVIADTVADQVTITWLDPNGKRLTYPFGPKSL